MTDNIWDYKVLKPPRIMKSRCGCTSSIKGTTQIKCCSFSETDRLKIFNRFFENGLERKKSFYYRKYYNDADKKISSM